MKRKTILLAPVRSGGDHPAMPDDDDTRGGRPNAHPALFEVRTAPPGSWVCFSCGHLNVDGRVTCARCTEVRPDDPRRRDGE